PTSDSATVGHNYADPLIVTARDASNNPVPNIGISFTMPTIGPSGTLSALTGVTDAIGQVSVTLLANLIAGGFNIGVNTTDGSNLSASALRTNVADKPNSVVLSGDGQSAVVGGAYGSALVATVYDEFNNPVSGADVAFVLPTVGPSG